MKQTVKNFVLEDLGTVCLLSFSEPGMICLPPTLKPVGSGILFQIGDDTQSGKAHNEG
jgi:hypothetical protein